MHSVCDIQMGLPFWGIYSPLGNDYVFLSRQNAGSDTSFVPFTAEHYLNPSFQEATENGGKNFTAHPF